MAGRRCRNRVLHTLDQCGAESSKEVLHQLVRGFMLTFHLVHGGFDGDDAVLWTGRSLIISEGDMGGDW